MKFLRTVTSCTRKGQMRCITIKGELNIFNPNDKVKVKISLLQAVEAHRIARGQGSHIT
jgi:hypothetical protein